MRISDWSSDVCSSDLGWRMSCAYVLVIPSDYRALDKRSPMIASCRRFWFTFGGRGIAMHGAFKFVAIFGVGFSLASHTPLPAFPASTLDALDPSHLATLFCGAEDRKSTRLNSIH